jgi:BASS family bile acid:Na+ symporter
MHSLDTVSIHFNPAQMATLNFALAFLMFSVALDVRVSDFKQVLRFPKSVGVGLLAQYLAFPAATLLLIALFSPPASVALGMVLVSMCPSGNLTNFLVQRAGANIALSVTFNAIVILLASVVTPSGFLLLAKLVPGTESLRAGLELGFGEMGAIIVQLILAPLLAGMALNHRFPALTARMRKPVSTLGLLIFFAILAIAVWGNRDNIAASVGSVFPLVALHNALALGTGYALGKLFALPERDARALAFETGVHNTGLGLLLIFKFFNGLGGMALLAAWWGIWDMVAGFALASFWRGRPLSRQAELLGSLGDETPGAPLSSPGDGPLPARPGR